MDILQIICVIFIGLFVIVIALFLLTVFVGAPYVPTLQHNLTKNLQKLYPLQPNDLLIDLGSGDGVILQHAMTQGATALGIELNPILAIITHIRFRKTPQITIKCRNFYHTKFPKGTTVIYAFSVSAHINKIYEKIQQEANRLDKPLYFISNAFMAKQAKPIKHAGTFYLYKILPRPHH